MVGFRDMLVEVVKGRKRRVRKVGMVAAIIRRAMEMKSVRGWMRRGSLVVGWELIGAGCGDLCRRGWREESMISRLLCLRQDSDE